MATKQILDITQLKSLSIDEIRAKIVERGADWHPVEKKPDLIGRLLQLQGTAQPIDKIKKELKKAGIGDDDTPTIPVQTNRLTRAQIDEALKKYVKRGLEYRVSKDGTKWMMMFKTEQLLQNGKVVPSKRIDSGNTMIPINVLKTCADTLTTISVRKVVEKEVEDFRSLDDVDAEEAA